MEEKIETYAYFFVADFECNPSEITKALELEPTEVTLKGQPLTNGRPRKRSSWKVHSSLSREEPFQDAHLSNLVEKLLPKKQQIKEIASKFSVGINCVGYYKNVHPGFHLNKALIAQCAELNLDIDFDLYNFSE